MGMLLFFSFCVDEAHCNFCHVVFSKLALQRRNAFSILNNELELMVRNIVQDVTGVAKSDVVKRELKMRFRFGIWETADYVWSPSLVSECDRNDNNKSATRSLDFRSVVFKIKFLLIMYFSMKRAATFATYRQL